MRRPQFLVGETHFERTARRRSLTQSIPNIINTGIIWDTTLYDNQSFATLAAAVFTFRVAGFYHITYNITWAANAVGNRSATISKNGALGIMSVINVVGTAAPFLPSHSLAGQFQLAVGDTITFMCNQSSGAALGTSPGAGFNYPTMCGITLMERM